MRVVGYARTSWEEQVGARTPSVSEQEGALTDFAHRTGLTLVAVHTDSGLSPNHGTCAGLITILDSMEEGWDAVIVISLCRLRNVPAVSFDPLEELRDSGKRVLVANEGTERALAQLLPKRAQAVAPEEEDEPPQSESERRREIAERLLKGREAGAKAGKHQSGPAPFGYRRDYSKRGSDGVLLVPDEVEADIVRLIFREYLRLRSMKRLIKLLDEQGLRTRRGKRWSRAGVSWILKNDTYVGRVHFGDIHVKGRHDSIVAPILFNKVQKLIRANNKRNRKPRAASKPRVAAATAQAGQTTARQRREREHASVS